VSYPENKDAAKQREDLLGLINTAIGSDVDVVADEGSGFLAIMGKSNPNIRQDVPAAFEMYTLLSHYLPKLPLHAVPLGGVDVLLTPSVLYDSAAGRVVALIPIEANQMELVAYWITDQLRSSTVKAMAGLLALPFSVEEHDGVRHMIPEWFGAFYVNGNEDHCVPILALRSVTYDQRFGDWVAVALERMQVFGLPCDAANKATQQKTSH
jgi:hypothetical protein